VLASITHTLMHGVCIDLSKTAGAESVFRTPAGM
jgi:hypothetical protein